MRYIDLSHTLHHDTSVFPGDRQIELDHVKTLERDGFNNFWLSTGMHVGTHIDGPMHLTHSTVCIGQIPLDWFAGRGILIDVRGEKTIKFRDSLKKMVSPGDIVLFYSGLDLSFGTAGYFNSYPDFSVELAQFLADSFVKIVGIDWVSPDHEPYSVHNILLGNNVLLLENLTNLDQLVHEPNFEVFAFPIKINADSSIVRAVARAV